MKKPEELQLADKLDIPHELISLIQDDPEIILAWYHEQRQNKPSLPSSITSDPERRAELVLSLKVTTDEENLIVRIDTPIHQHLHFTQRHLIDLQAAT